jgi:elongation factor G
MRDHGSQHIRNLALLGHSGAGKTLLLEALLLKSGAQGEMGSLERGTTLSDHDPQEKRYQHSLNSSLCSLDFEGTHLNVIDTPGDPDFRGQTLAAMSAVETAVIVINASQGIQASTRRLMRRARQRKRCRVLLINRIDAEDADLEQLVRDIREEFGPECLPINLPCDQGAAVRDCFYRTDGQTDIFSVATAHTANLDQVVEMDETLMSAYLDGEAIDTEALHDAFEASLREGHLIPICFTSASTGAGCGEFLRFAKRLLPNPAEGNPPPFRSGPGDQRVGAKPDPDGHVLAHVFKISNDPYAGKLSIFRLYQGTVTPESLLIVGDSRRAFKAAHLYRIQGKEHIEVDRAIPGDLCALAKQEEIHYDAVLHDCHDEDHHYLKPIDFPQPMFGLAVEAATRGQEQKLATALHRLSEEDPCFRVEHHQELNETVIRGLGEMHLRIMLERIKERYNVDVETRTPRIAYRETITRSAEGHYRHKKQTGGAGQFGEVFLRVRPLGRGEGFVFKSEVVGGAIPSNLIPAVEKGTRQLLEEGAVAGFPLQDLEVVVYDGKHHPVDSKEVAFVVAGRRAFLEAVLAAGPQILEPIVDLELEVQDTVMGDVTGSLASKRARIQAADSLKGAQASISAAVPLSAVLDFPTELKSLTGGQGRYTLAFSHYEAVPGGVQKSLVEAFQAERREAAGD